MLPVPEETQDLEPPFLPFLSFSGVPPLLLVIGTHPPPHPLLLPFFFRNTRQGGDGGVGWRVRGEGGSRV